MTYPTRNSLDTLSSQLLNATAAQLCTDRGHNVLLIGPPGAGKTMPAKRLPTILPALRLEESLETTRTRSVAGELKPGTSLLATHPVRSHHPSAGSVCR